MTISSYKASLVWNPWTCQHADTVGGCPDRWLVALALPQWRQGAQARGSILFMLITWLIWKEWPYFQQEELTSTQLLNRIKEAELWCQASAEALSTLGACSFQDQARSSARTS